MSDIRIGIPTTQVTLLSRLRERSNDGAWREFENRYRDLLLRFCRRRGLQPADAEDVVQNVFLSLSKSLPGFTYDPRLGRFRDYLFRCIRHAITKSRTHWGFQSLSASPMAGASGTVDPSIDESAAWEREWAAHHYRRALSRLRAEVDASTVQILERSVAGSSAESLAAEFGIEVESVYRARHRARQRLQTFVEEQIREEDGTMT
ncbi:MAG: sigma-70 family RNA polymerase sigma factor [Phycisphaerales bacterium]|nr:sigma-70 family RNA polymerase sigma factor [Phycisphaerales bacterium]